MHQIILALAQAATGGDAAPATGGTPAGGCAGGGGLGSFIPLLLMFVIFYFMLIRPQQKKAKEHQSFLTNLKKGEQVITRGGVIGRITGVTDNMVVLEIQEKVRVRVLKSHIEGTHRDSAPSAAPDKKPKEEAAPPPST